MIAENMRKMPQMIAEYRQKRREFREKAREKKKQTEEELYLIATGKKVQSPGENWEIFRDKKSKK